ncbi:MAG: helix-turn-helix transcriptional regulator [Syntrophothermus sp.]|uniref:helix-turn-helix domain-containing protein n=1 Tax=Syntrophothermus sp. TaxID=2736299 RepID=UPI00257C1B91|nr:helix-turn-helix transcriptional regulator [Syntrophothermus sp.]NSW84662.1 helix-turn-helix transcriptional regulator [Syntrophothermus sp.]
MNDKARIYKEIGRRLKSAREKAGLTQMQVAKLLGMAREVVSYYENGTREIGIDDILRFANLYGTDPRCFMPETEVGEIETPNLSMAFRAKQIAEGDLPIIAEAQRLLNNLYELTVLLEGEKPSGHKVPRPTKST